MKATFAHKLKSALHTLADLIYPRFCMGCEMYISDPEHRYLCKTCSNEIEYAWRQRCAFCGGQTIDGKTCAFCKSDHALDQLIHATDFEENIIKEAIHAFKYDFIRQLETDLAPHLIHRYDKYLKEKILPAKTLVVPIPLHWSRQNWRGYNQAELLAQRLCEENNLELKTRILKRAFQWDHQAEISGREERITNAQASFYLVQQAHDRLNGKTIILIDDVATTGATLDEAAKILKNAGADKVIALVLARG